jgi:hypothetical protein
MMGCTLPEIWSTSFFKLAVETASISSPRARRALSTSSSQESSSRLRRALLKSLTPVWQAPRLLAAIFVFYLPPRPSLMASLIPFESFESLFLCFGPLVLPMKLRLDSSLFSPPKLQSHC